MCAIYMNPHSIVPKHRSAIWHDDRTRLQRQISCHIRTNNPTLLCIKPTFSFNRNKRNLTAWMWHHRLYLSTCSTPSLSLWVVIRFTSEEDQCAVNYPSLARGEHDWIQKHMNSLLIVNQLTVFQPMEYVLNLTCLKL